MDGAVASNATEDPRDALWARFAVTRSPQARDALVLAYLPLAAQAAGRAYGQRRDNSISFADLQQYARVGLLEAIERFDATRGIPFPAYAAKRIRGAILNGLPQESELAAQREYRRRVLRERTASLVQHGVADPVRASLEELAAITVKLAIGLLADAGEAAPEDESAGSNPYASAELAQLRERLRPAIEQLPPREREIIAGHYLEQLEFQAIAYRLAVTKGRVSQLHAQALERLRTLLASSTRVDRRL